MAYMRGDPYIYSDGESLQIHYHGNSLALPMEIFDQLVVMRWYRMTPEQREAVASDTYQQHSGNFGTDGIARHLGQPTTMDLVKQDAALRND